MNKELENEKNLYRTADMAITAALCLYFPIERIEKLNHRRSYFLFKRSKRLDNLVSDYWAGKLKVDPQAYFNQLKNIKTRLYSQD